MSGHSSQTLVHLLSSTPYTLAYSLPLLCLSLVLTFAGTFLMLDRSRSFSPSADYDALPGVFEKGRKHKFVWYWEGGIGGLACGFTTGLHLASFLSLLIPSTTSSAPLSPKSFLATWLLICILTTLLAARYRYAALTMTGFSGGALLSLVLCVIIHPPLLPRVILTAIIAPLLTCLSLLFYFVPKLHSWLLHPTLRLCTSSNGAFGIVLSIALLSNPQIEAWANVWERFWLANGIDWGTGKEKALSATFCILLVLGSVSDWALRRWLGECPDEKWDKYLSNYMANLPNSADRAGVFEPPKSFWDRFFPRNERDPITFLPDSDPKADIQSDEFLSSHSMLRSGGFLKKTNAKSSPRRSHRYYSVSRKRKPVKFGALDELSSSDEDFEEDDLKKSPLLFPPLTNASSSTPTLVDEPPKALQKKSSSSNTPTAHGDPAKPTMIDYDAELAELNRLRGGNVDSIPDYSDHEEDLTSIDQRPSADLYDRERWSPAFMRRHGTSLTPDPNTRAHGAAAVPATPSLIKAFHRIALAQRDAFDPHAVVGEGDITAEHASSTSSKAARHPLRKRGMSGAGVEGDEGEEEEDFRNARDERTPQWEEFWRQVRHKANS